MKQFVQKRGLAAAASGSFQYQTGEASGVQYASRDLPSATTTLAVVAKAGSRYQAYPGFSDALEKFAFKVGTIGTDLKSKRPNVSDSLHTSDQRSE